MNRSSSSMPILLAALTLLLLGPIAGCASPGAEPEMAEDDQLEALNNPGIDVNGGMGGRGGGGG